VIATLPRFANQYGLFMQRCVASRTDDDSFGLESPRQGDSAIGKFASFPFRTGGPKEMSSTTRASLLSPATLPSDIAHVRHTGKGQQVMLRKLFYC